MNPYWVANGRSTLFPRPEPVRLMIKHMEKARDRFLGLKPEMYKYYREQEEENILLRKMKEDKAVLDLVIARLDDPEISFKPEEFDEVITDKFIRSKVFYKMSDMIEAIDRKTKQVHPATRKLLLSRLNRYSKAGIFTR